MSKRKTAAEAVYGETARHNRRGDLISEVIEDAPDAIWVLDASGESPHSYTIAYANAAFEAIYETWRENAIGQEAAAFLASRALAGDLTPSLEALSAGQPFRLTRFHRRRDGQPMWLQVSYRPTSIDDGTRWIIVSRDVTDTVLAQHRAARLARAMDELYEAIAVEAVRKTTWCVDYVNQAFSAVLGYRPDEVIGRSWRSLLAPDADYKRAEDCRVGLLTGQHVHAELLFRHKDGNDVLLNFSATPIAEEGSDQYTSAVTIFRDVTKARREEQHLREQARRDPLTGLYNRREFERLLEGAIAMTAEGRRAHMLLFIDLDRFKHINDTLGHDAGDRVLTAVARVLKSQVLGSDHLARWGGDEFAAILYFCDMANAVNAAEKMIAALAKSPECHGVGASIGVVPIGTGVKREQLIRRADQLVYEAKSAGRNRVVT